MKNKKVDSELEKEFKLAVDEAGPLIKTKLEQAAASAISTSLTKK